MSLTVVKSDASVSMTRDGKSLSVGRTDPSISMEIQYVGVIPDTQLQLLKFAVKYNATDYGSYITSAPFSDSGTIAASARVISLETIAPNGVGNANAAAGCAYIPDDANGDRIVIHEEDGPIASFFPANNMVQAARLFTVSGSQQGITVDPINQYLFIHDSSSGTITVKDFNGNTITTYTAPTAVSNVQMYFDYNAATPTWYCAVSDTSVVAVQRWTLSGSVVSLAETYWFKTADGICLSNVFDQLINFDNSGGNARIRWQDIDGKTGIFISDVALSFATEGLVEYPDGTIGNCNPAGFFSHGGVVGGNRWMHSDPKNLYLKYDRAPSMTRFSKFKGGSITGNFAKQVLTHNAPIMSPVYDFGSNTNQQNLSAWEYEVESGATASLEFRGSSSAPSTTPATAYFSNVPTYDANGSNDGWGTTTPGAWQSTPTTDRYMQCRITLLTASTPSTSLQTLIDALGANLKVLIAEHDSGTMYIYNDSTSPTFQIPIAVNQADPTNNFAQTTANQRLSYNSASFYVDDNSNNSNWILDTPSNVTSDQMGQVTVIQRRESATIRAIPFAVSVLTSTSHRIACRHNASGDTPASEVCIEHWDGSGAVVNRVGIADTGLVFKRVDYLSTGSAWEIWFNRVSQTLNVSVGSNNGNWFGDLTAPNRVASGVCWGSTSITGRGRFRLLIYGNTNWNSAQNDAIDAYITANNLLA